MDKLNILADRMQGSWSVWNFPIARVKKSENEKEH